MKTLPVLALALAPLTIACGGGGEDPPAASESTEDTPEVAQAELEKVVEQKMTEYAGVAPDRIECPEEGLSGEVGETVRCTLFAGRDTVGITVTVTAVDGTTIDFDIEADDKVDKG